MSEHNRFIPREPTEDEDAAIEAAIASDPDAQGWDDDNGEWMTFAEAHPEWAARREQAKQQKSARRPKTKIDIRLDADVVEHLRSMGKGWQTKLNETLRRVVFGDPETSSLHIRISDTPADHSLEIEAAKVLVDIAVDGAVVGIRTKRMSQIKTLWAGSEEPR